MFLLLNSLNYAKPLVYFALHVVELFHGPVVRTHWVYYASSRSLLSEHQFRPFHRSPALREDTQATSSIFNCSTVAKIKRERWSDKLSSHSVIGIGTCFWTIPGLLSCP